MLNKQGIFFCSKYDAKQRFTSPKQVVPFYLKSYASLGT
ncbi:hypothetical protein DU19_0932 [Chlamydia muridarum]|nr:hypothetical protein DU17_0934 [Chlamydia muridarum]KDU81873.1 hypothetical protein DU18_0933 [Chlamydia muridarum]KDU82553.1 hypothetical protein DU19_0932 [Chlamydia muridarum]KDU83827.1 hypothetical protein DU20_0932 [Chlamydia muridarum]KDU84106.1 hypothetical protein DU21_0934 [Chlamydia muridarum]